MSIIYELDQDEVARLADMLTGARDDEARVRITCDTGLMIKIGEGMWTAPMGRADRPVGTRLNL